MRPFIMMGSLTRCAAAGELLGSFSKASGRVSTMKVVGVASGCLVCMVVLVAGRFRAVSWTVLLLGDRIYSRNGQSLEEVVGDMLRERHNTLSVAESCTGGLLGEHITSVPGSSTYFLGGFITYASRMKVEWLGVPEDIIAQFGAVSKETAEAMALGARRRTGSTYALAITGVAGPDSGGEKAPVGTIFVGLADAAGCQVLHRQFLGDRTRIRQFATQMALDMLRRKCARIKL